MTTSYDDVAATYDTRYERHGYGGIEATVSGFAGDAPKRVLEVGCGTGHWLARLAKRGHCVTGVDASSGMLEHATLRVRPGALHVARAEALPFADGQFDRVLCVNALHHFGDPKRAICEARRVLATGGAFLTIGLDPATEQDEWCIYDYFEGSRARDRERYPPADKIRTWLSEAGFARVETAIAETINQDVPATEALASGALGRHVTSQLSELSDEAYARGIARIEAAARSVSGPEPLTLRIRLRLFATTGHVDGDTDAS